MSKNTQKVNMLKHQNYSIVPVMTDDIVIADEKIYRERIYSSTLCCRIPPDIEEIYECRTYLTSWNSRIKDKEILKLYDNFLAIKDAQDKCLMILDCRNPYTVFRTPWTSNKIVYGKKRYQAAIDKLYNEYRHVLTDKIDSLLFYKLFHEINCKSTKEYMKKTKEMKPKYDRLKEKILLDYQIKKEYYDEHADRWEEYEEKRKQLKWNEYCIVLVNPRDSIIPFDKKYGVREIEDNVHRKEDCMGNIVIHSSKEVVKWNSCRCNTTWHMGACSCTSYPETIYTYCCDKCGEIVDK